MQCIRPFIVKRKVHFPGLNTLYVPVRCGSCMPCRVSKARDWAIRLSKERRRHEDCFFLSLTYNDEFLPKDKSVDIEVMKLFWKRLRKALNFIPIRYYQCGEYGEEDDRPHYHACVFGWHPNDLRLGCHKDGKDYYYSPFIEKIWSDPDTKQSYGFNTVGTVTSKSCNYVCGYIREKLTGEAAEYYTKLGVKPPFGSGSKDLGLLSEKEVERIRNNGYMLFQGKKVPIPKYYCEKYNFFNTYFKDYSEKRSREDLEVYKKKIEEDGDLLYDYKRFQQFEKNVNSRFNLRKRGVL